MGLEDYKEIVATSATLFTMGHMLSGILVCKDIHKKGSSEGFDAKPFAGGIGMGILMLQYALILKDPAMINVNVFGLLTNLAYITLFYIYAPKKSDILGLIGKAVAVAAVFVAYAFFEHTEKIEFRFGLITTVLLLLLISTPLMNLGEVIRTKSTAILPFPLILMGTIVSSQWLLYGILIQNSFIIFQNIVGFGLYLIQLSLFMIFPSKATNTKDNIEKDD